MPARGIQNLCTDITRMKPPRTQPTVFFRLIVPATVVFILTILALIACLFGNPDAPVAQWLDANGNTLLLTEFVAVIALSILAMFIDRMRTLRGIDEPLVTGNISGAATDSVSSSTTNDSAESAGI